MAFTTTTTTLVMIMTTLVIWSMIQARTAALKLLQAATGVGLHHRPEQ